MTEEQPEPAVFATVRSYPDLIAAFRKRVDQMQVAYETVDQIAGMPLRYFNKVVAPHASRHLGSISLGPYLETLGLTMVLVEDSDDYDAIRRRLEQRRKNADASNASATKRRKRPKRLSFLKGCASWSRVMNARRTFFSTSEERVSWARNAAEIRWQRYRRAKNAADVRWAKQRAAVGGQL